MAKEENYIKAREKFIAQFDSLNPKNGSELMIKNLAEQYKLSLKNLEKSRQKLIKLFSLGEIDIEKAKSKEDYPPAVRNFHLVLASILGAAVFTAVFALVGSYFGGPIIENWTPSLLTTSAIGGAIPAIPAAIGSFFLSKKSFDAERVSERKISLQKRILNRSRQKQTARDLIAAEISDNLDTILDGKYTFKESFQITKDKKTKTITRYKKNFKHLPLLTKLRLSSLIKEIEENSANLYNIHDKLSNRVDDIKKLNAKRKRSEAQRKKKTNDGINPTIKKVEAPNLVSENPNITPGQISFDDLVAQDKDYTSANDTNSVTAVSTQNSKRK